MLKQHDNYYLQQSKSNKDCLLALRDIILSQDAEITAEWKYQMPFFCYKNKMFCYLWVNKKTGQPYIGFVEGNRLSHPDLFKEKRSRMSVMYIDPQKDIPIKTIQSLLHQATSLYKTGKIKLNKIS